MKLNVMHRTVYNYEEPQRHVLQSQRLTPSVFDGQTTVDWRVTTEGAVTGSGFRDSAGDWLETVRVAGPVSRVAVEVSGTVETQDLAGVLRGHREKAPPLSYMRSTRATRADIAITDLAASALDRVEDGSPGVLNKAHALRMAVEDAVRYAPGSTQAHTTATEALSQGEGVCQDHAHVMIAAARTLGIPARYVAGYLFSGDDSNAMTEASHAWAELYIPNLGWVGFDAANGCCPDERYIRLCSGADAFDAAPIRGLAGGLGGEALDVAVAVSAHQQ